MSDQTQIKNEVYDTAKAIGQIMDEHRAAFEAIHDVTPNAGMFATAQWLERIVGDRRDGVYEQYKRLEMIFENLGTKLHTIADSLFGTDYDNAKALGDFMDMKKDIDAELADYDKKTESEQNNFSPSGDDKGNAGDGYGYDDNENHA